jgi:YD repeat-containing protein
MLIALLPPGAAAQGRTFYGADGKLISRSTTDSSGAVMFYGPDGRVTARTSTESNGTTMIYDAGGRRVGSVTTQSPTVPHR